jgi:hypothetical protein
MMEYNNWRRFNHFIFMMQIFAHFLSAPDKSSSVLKFLVHLQGIKWRSSKNPKPVPSLGFVLGLLMMKYHEIHP